MDTYNKRGKGVISRISSSKELSDAFYLFLLQGVNYILPLVVIPYLMVTLGSERYGYIGFSIAFIQYFMLFVDFGFGLSATKRIAIAYGQDKRALSKIFFSTLYAKLLLFGIATLIFFSLTFCIPQFRLYRVTVLCTYPMLIGTTLTFSWFYQGIGKIKVISLINTLSKALVLPLTFIFVKTADDYNIAAFIQSSVVVVGAVISLFHLVEMKAVSRSKVSFADMKVEMKESFPLFLSTVATSVYTQFFTIILALLATPTVVGRYSAAERLMRSLCFVLYTPISMAFYPRMAALSAKNRQAAQVLLKKIFCIVAAIMCGVCMCLFFFSDYACQFLGKDYHGISTLLKMMAFAPLAIGLGGILGQVGLVAMGDARSKRDFRRVYFVVAIVALFSVGVLSPLFKEVGAAVALLLTEYLVFVLMVYYTKKNRIC
jgi:O-antigen/teichoic acid export membrane protein